MGSLVSMTIKMNLVLYFQTNMPFILKNKETDQYRIFGSLPILCKSVGYDKKKEKNLLYNFSQKKKNRVEDDNFLIVKAEIERGGSNNL